MWIDEESRYDQLDPFGPEIGTIYLICFRKKLGHAKHYCGWAKDLKKRIRVQKRGGAGAARLLVAAKDAGIAWRVVATWPGTRSDERRMKENNDLARACPICRARVLRQKARAARKRRAARKKAEEHGDGGRQHRARPARRLGDAGGGPVHDAGGAVGAPGGRAGIAACGE